MIKLNLLIAFRNGLKNRSFSLINLLGLTIGFAAVFYILLFVLYELNYDQFHKNKEALYRVLYENTENNFTGRSTSTMLGQTIHADFPEFTLCRFGNDPIKIGEEDPLIIEDFFWSDSSFFEVFSFPLLKGDPKQVLKEPNSIVITNSIANKLFPGEDPFEKIIEIKIFDSDEKVTVKITGIAMDPPANSSIQFQALGSMYNAEQMYGGLLTSWGFNWLSTYIYAPQSSKLFVEEDFPEMMSEKLSEFGMTNLGVVPQSMNDIYLHSSHVDRGQTDGSIQVVLIMAAIGALILIISLFNYINLNTARVFTRMKEIKVKHSLGSSAFQVFWQHMIEANLYMFITGVLGIFITYLFIEQLNSMFDINVSIFQLGFLQWFIIAVSLLLAGSIAGVLSGVKLVKGLRASLTSNLSKYDDRRGNGRKMLMGAQYIITLFLTTITIVVYLQFKYMSEYDLGFDSNQLISIPVDDRVLQDKIATIKSEFLSISGVNTVASSSESLPSNMNNTYDIQWEGRNEDTEVSIDVVGVDNDYFSTVGIDIVRGENFINDYAIDSGRTVVLNEAAMAIIGDDNIVGKAVAIGGASRTVMGIVENHHYRPLKSAIGPVAYLILPPGNRVSPDNIFLRISEESGVGLQKNIAMVWSQFSPDPLQFSFVSDEYNNAYKVEQRLMLLANSLTFVAIVIAFMGLFGLITFMVQQRIKELCVRKILGAPVSHLANILSKDFIIIFCIAGIIASPLAYIFGKQWLENYPYNIGFNPIILLGAFSICILISALVIGIRIYDLSATDPAKVLRND